MEAFFIRPSSLTGQSNTAYLVHKAGGRVGTLVTFGKDQTCGTVFVVAQNGATASFVASVPILSENLDYIASSLKD